MDQKPGVFLRLSVSITVRHSDSPPHAPGDVPRATGPVHAHVSVSLVVTSWVGPR